MPASTQFLSKWLKRLGQTRTITNQQRFKALSEAFSAVKEVKVSGLEYTYIQRFAKPAKIYAKGQATANVIAQLPRYMLEAVAFGGLLLVILFLIARNGSFINALPTIALYALAGYRLLPALQQIYASLTRLTFVGPALDALHQDLSNLQTFKEAEYQDIKSLPFTKAIKLEQISYRYPNAANSTLNQIDLEIPVHNTIGFVGSTGSGKTTIVDLITALLEPEKGKLIVDDQLITSDNRRNWQRTIGYVPQHIFLADDITANIAFGVKEGDIDLQSFKRATKICKSRRVC